MFGKHMQVIHYVVQLVFLLTIVSSLGCSVEASNGLSDEQAAMGAEFGRVWVKPGAQLYTLQLDSSGAAGSLILSRTVQTGGFVALIGHNERDSAPGSCTYFDSGLAAIELTNVEPSPTFFVEKNQLLGIALTSHDPKGIGIRTESVLQTATLDTCGSLVSSSTQIQNTALLRPVLDNDGAVMPLYLDVTSVALRIVPATNEVEALDTCIPEAFWDSSVGRALIDFDGNNYLGPNHPGDECRQDGQDGYFVRLTKGDANRLIGTTTFAELERFAYAGIVVNGAPSSAGRVLRAAVILGLGAIGIGGVFAVLRSSPSAGINLPSPVLASSTALDMAKLEAALSVLSASSYPQVRDKDGHIVITWPDGEEWEIDLNNPDHREAFVEMVRRILLYVQAMLRHCNAVGDQDPRCAELSEVGIGEALTPFYKEIVEPLAKMLNALYLVLLNLGQNWDKEAACDLAQALIAMLIEVGFTPSAPDYTRPYFDGTDGTHVHEFVRDRLLHYLTGGISSVYNAFAAACD